MSLADSKFLKKVDPGDRKKKSPPNQWKETTISEGMLRDLLAPWLSQLRFVAADQEVERIVIGEAVNGLYPLTFSVNKEKNND